MKKYKYTQILQTPSVAKLSQNTIYNTNITSWFNNLGEHTKAFLKPKPMYKNLAVINTIGK